MGVWKVPGSVQDAEELKYILQQPLEACKAGEVLYGLLGADGLFDHILKARRDDPRNDVRGLVVNAINEIVFTSDDPTNVAGIKPVIILEQAVDEFEADEDDVFGRIAVIRSAADAFASFRHALEITDEDKHRWTVAKDPQDQDFLARHEDGRLFRLLALDDVVLTVDRRNRARYERVFDNEASLAR